MTLTGDELKKTLDRIIAARPLMDTYRGLQVIFTPAATQEGARLFPVSKNRSKRIEKKLIKRFGGTHRRDPAMYRFGDKLYAHPSYRAALAAIEPKKEFDR